MTVRVLFFATLADITGTLDTCVDELLGPDIASVFASFARLHPELEAHRPSMKCALNSEFADPGSRVHDGDEVAFFPPVSGG